MTVVDTKSRRVVGANRIIVTDPNGSFAVISPRKLGLLNRHSNRGCMVLSMVDGYVRPDHALWGIRGVYRDTIGNSARCLVDWKHEMWHYNTTINGLMVPPNE